MQYVSTRGAAPSASFTETLLSGLAPDGGLYMPSTWPSPASEATLSDLAHRSYTEIAAHVLAPFVGDLFPSAGRGDERDEPSELLESLQQAYASFEAKEVVPCRSMAPGEYLLEAFHGPTLSFKDVAMQLLGTWVPTALRRRNRRALIVGATSGDTGSAAIAAFAFHPEVDIVILHPHERVTEAQRRQMTTTEAPNVHNVAIEGTFDDCQDIVKSLFVDPSFSRSKELMGVNSINFARVLAQSVYYVATATKLHQSHGSRVDFIVPTGNFGNILAAYLARKMGFPIGNLVVATNANDVLYRAWKSADTSPQTVVPTYSPAMDIQISSNFERYVYLALNGDGERTHEWMNHLRGGGQALLPPAVAESYGRDFVAARASNEQTLAAMREARHGWGEILDPHTAVGYHAMKHTAVASTERPRVLVSTAHPAKFRDAVAEALGETITYPDRLAAVFSREERFEVLPSTVRDVKAWIERTVP